MPNSSYNINDRLGTLVNNEKGEAVSYRDYSLANIRKILNYLNNPQDGLIMVHIAGTNGKGTVAHLLNSILVKSGYRTGLFTSPHLVSVNERIMINECKISNRELSVHVDTLFHSMKQTGTRLTYFDSLAVIAFLHFSHHNIDCGIIETGLGGIKDSTNVIKPCLTIITKISRDHTGVLGTTLREIGENKAGIIKPCIPLVTSHQHASVMGILTDHAKIKKAPLYIQHQDFFTRRLASYKPGSETFDFFFGKYSLPGCSINMPGEHAVTNASLAISACCLLRANGFTIQDSAVKSGLAVGAPPGRFSILSRKPFILFDPAHNPAAIRALVKTLKSVFSKHRIVTVMSILRDKDYRSMMKTMLENFSSPVLYYEIADPRSLVLNMDDIPSVGNRNVKVISGGIDMLLRTLRNEATDNTIFVFTGSFRLYGTAKKISDLWKS